MSDLQHIPSRPGIAGATLSPEQKRFTTLIAQIEQARKLLADWHDAIAQYRQGYARVQVPLLAQWRAVRRTWAMKLDAAGDLQRWNRVERETLGTLVCDAIDDLPDARDDTELKALYDKWAEVDFDTEQSQRLLALEALADAVAGPDPNEDDGRADEDLATQRLRAGMKARADTQAPHRKTAAQKRQESEAREATLSVREVFRKLASALHPDRETDAVQRAAKTVLMQEANQAYAANDLLTLLELQLRIEQIDNEHLAGADAGRLKHYNQVLAVQLKELKQETDRVSIDFGLQFGLDPAWRPTPKRLGAALAENANHLRRAVALTEGEIRMFGDPAATRRWLKVQRRRLQEGALDLFDWVSGFE